MKMIGNLKSNLNLALLALTLLSSLGHANEAKTNQAAADGMGQLVSQILGKLGAIQDFSFDLNIDTSLPGLPLGDSNVSVEVPLLDDIESNIGLNNTDKPNLFIGEKGVVVVANADIKRSDTQLALAATMSFKNSQGKSSYLPVTLAMGGYPNLKLRMAGISVSSILNDPNSAIGKLMPLGEKIQGACRADLQIANITGGADRGKEIWKPLTACTFVATYNKEQKKYDVKLHFKNQ